MVPNYNVQIWESHIKYPIPGACSKSKFTPDPFVCSTLLYVVLCTSVPSLCQHNVPWPDSSLPWYHMPLPWLCGGSTLLHCPRQVQQCFVALPLGHSGLRTPLLCVHQNRMPEHHRQLPLNTQGEKQGCWLPLPSPCCSPWEVRL